MKKKALVIIAPGFEEIEAMAPVDLLRRASVEVTIAGTIDGAITGRNGIKLLPDCMLETLQDEIFDALILPGGLDGTKNLIADRRVRSLIERHDIGNKVIAAICAAPTVLIGTGIAERHVLTSHPSVSGEFKRENYREERVVADGNLITSRGPGTALEFSLALVELLCGRETKTELVSSIVA